MNQFKLKTVPYLSHLTSGLLVGGLLLSLAACSPMPAEDAQSGGEAPVNGNGQPETMTPKSDANPLMVVDELCQKVAASWQAEKAKKDEVLLATKFVISGKNAVVIGGGEGAVVKKGMDAVNQVPDMTVTLPLNVAQEIIAGSTSLSAALTDGVISTDNEEGLARFLSYTQDGAVDEAAAEPPTASAE